MEEINALRDMGTYTDGAKDAVEIAIEDTRHFEKTDPEFEALAIYITMEYPETNKLHVVFTYKKEPLKWVNTRFISKYF
ncbi:hypothetical protein DPMN_155401 [Dreissena polymorpha]|uniref:Uncharacterized protein n=1 Tax=Dreissena polymorpha TaxID=45954 RepID=A0A9D4J7U4_DREPO|nr:hypothetical protein DPMN_155401 [Dreissena polymorpha]